MEEHRFILVIALNYLVAPKGAIVVLGEVATHHLHLTQTLRRASDQRSHLVFLFSCSASCPFFLQGGQEAQTPSSFSIPLHPLWAAAVAVLQVTVELSLVLLWKFGAPSLHSPAFHHLARRMLLSFRSPAFFFLCISAPVAAFPPGGGLLPHPNGLFCGGKTSSGHHSFFQHLLYKVHYLLLKWP